LALYVASCVLPAIGKPRNVIPGIVCLIWVPWVCLFPGWWANPLFFAGCSFLGGRRPAAARSCAILALLLAASVPLTTGGLDCFQIGYAFWTASIALLAVASFCRIGRPLKPAKVDGFEDF
jgi:hypothetical protein